MKFHTFAVTLKLSGDITDDKAIEEMTQNIADAVKRQIDNTGIAPDLSDVYVESFTVTPQHLPDAAITVDLTKLV